MSVVGARPNFMKIAPIARVVEEYNQKRADPRIEHLIVHTGQHYDDRMSTVFFEQLDLPKPQINLEVGSASHAFQTAQIMQRFEPAILAEQPDILLVVGDVNSTIACTLVASKIQYHGTARNSRPTIVHVEAGLRSFDREMPEEINRVLTDALSDILFITEASAITNLRQEGIAPEKIYFVGNVMIDSLIRHLEKATKLDGLVSLGLTNKAYGVVTLHRPTNVDSADTLTALSQCMKRIGARIPIVFPVHPRTKFNLNRFGLFDDFAGSNGIHLIEPLGYFEFLHLLLHAGLVLTDSGGLQEETTFLGVPCITLRNNTERPVTVSLGTNYLVGTNPDKIIQIVNDILDGKGKKGGIPPLWDGNASKRIVEVLIKSQRDPFTPEDRSLNVF
jgi:UDP-N-acetylglucosamine 2-epimerase (non-hydrolysing)